MIQAASNPLVLVIADDLSGKTQLESALLEAGYHTVRAGSGVAGLAACARVRPDLVAIDATSGLDGVDYCQQLRQHDGGDRVPVLLANFSSDCGDIERALMAGATDCLSAPICESLLHQRVWSLLETRRTARQAERAAVLLARQQTWDRLLRDGLGRLGRQPQIVKLLERVREYWNLDGLVLFDRTQRSVLAAALFPGRAAPSSGDVARLLAVGSIDGAPVAYSDLNRTGLSTSIVEPLQEAGIEAIAVAIAAGRYMLCGFAGESGDLWESDNLERLSDVAYLAFLALYTFQPTD